MLFKSKMIAFLRPNVILGVTNPFFAKVFQNWPHIIRLTSSEEQQAVFGGKRKLVLFDFMKLLEQSMWRFIRECKEFRFICFCIRQYNPVC